MHDALARHLPLLASLGLASASVFVFGLLTDDFTARLVSKPIPILALIACALSLGRSSTYSRTIAAGLALCVVGDVLLEFRTPSLFLAGVGAFALGHLAYVIAFARRAPSLRPELLVPFALWIAWALHTLWPGLGGMRAPVAVYTGVICVMMWRAAALAASDDPSPWRWLALLGAVSFAFSDTLIALDRYHQPLPGVRVPIILTYYLAQLLITLSILPAQPPAETTNPS
jgi:uncharacterized membrane protein YhhN